MTILDSIRDFFKPREAAEPVVVQYEALIFNQKTCRRAVIISDQPITDDICDNLKKQIDDALENNTPVILDSHFDIMLMEPDRSYAFIVDGELDEQQFQRLKAEIDEMYTGPENANRPIILEGMKVVPLS